MTPIPRTQSQSETIRRALGQRKLLEKPWAKEKLLEKPWVRGTEELDAKITEIRTKIISTK